MKKVLVIASRKLWPITDGKSLTLYHNCKGLNEQYNYEVHLICFTNEEIGDEDDKPDFIKEVLYIRTPSMMRQISMVMAKSVLGKWPIQDALYYSKRAEGIIRDVYLRVNPDVLLIDMIRLVPYTTCICKTNSNEKWILIEDDLLSKRYKRQLQNLTNGSVVGQYSSNMPPVLDRITRLTFIKKAILKFEIHKLSIYEKSIEDRFDYVTFISPIETEEYNRINNTKKGITLTTGADVEYYSEEIEHQEQEDELVIMGNFGISANADSLRFICNEILPRIKNKCKFKVIGKCPQELIDELIDDKVAFLGYVDDIRFEIKSSAIFLSPIVYGTGIKTKIIEAMAMGIPVITNEVGVEGIAADFGKDIIVENNAEDLANRIDDLLVDETKRKTLGKNGQNFVKTHHSWDEVYKAFKKMGL